MTWAVPDVAAAEEAAGQHGGRVELVPGATCDRPRPVDLGVNHVRLDVDGVAQVRAGAEARWHHPVTESSGGAAAVC